MLEVFDKEQGMVRDEPGDHGEEPMVVDSISGTINLHDLMARLWILNRQGKLRQPLVGDLKTTIYIYKANEGENDIEQFVRATLLPPPMNEAEVPAGFEIHQQNVKTSPGPPRGVMVPLVLLVHPDPPWYTFLLKFEKGWIRMDRSGSRGPRGPPPSLVDQERSGPPWTTLRHFPDAITGTSFEMSCS